MNLATLPMDEIAAIQEGIKRGAARWAWKHWKEKTPNGITWAEWFKTKFGQTLEDYVKEVRQCEKQSTAPK